MILTGTRTPEGVLSSSKGMDITRDKESITCKALLELHTWYPRKPAKSTCWRRHIWPFSKKGSPHRKTSIALYWIPAARRWTPPYWILLSWQAQTSLQTQRQCIENISFHKQRGRLFKGSTRFIRTHTTVLLHTLKKDCWFSTLITIPRKQRIPQTQRHSFTSDNCTNCRNASL